MRVIAGDAPSNSNRGGAIRTIVAEQVLDKKHKALAIYGSIHCVHVGMGFPGELGDKYPGRFWSAYSFFDAEGAGRGRQLFGLGKGLRLGEMLDAIVWYGDSPDSVVPAKPRP